jgi:signal transduction histidine kinase
VAGIFAVTGAAWVLLTDIVLYEATRDPILVARIETAKGWAFVVLATVLLYLVTFLSVRRLARARAGITAVVESIADGVLLLGPDRIIQRANPAAIRMLGEDLVGMDAEQFSRRFRVSYLDRSLVPPGEFVSQRVFDEGGPLHYKAILYPDNGTERIVSVTAAAVRVYADDRPEAVVSVMHDITESERMNTLRDQFFAAAAHALKTPVAVIKANAQLLLTVGAGPARDAAVAIGQQCDRMDLLVQNLFVVGRIRTQSLRLYPQEVELLPLVEQVVAFVAARSTEHPIGTELSVRPQPRVHADQERLTLVLRNLLDEAVQLSVPSEPITVLLAHDGVDAEIGVRHHPGAASPETEPSGGEYDELGINRLVTSTIISAHGGDLRRETVGGEATAWIRLPMIETRW